MMLHNARDLEITRRKLRELEEAYESATRRRFDNAHVREATLRSLGQLINQLKEEIARFQARTTVRR